MKVFLPDGTELELEDGASGADAARAIGEGLARAALGIKVDGDLRDLEAPLEDGARIEIVTSRDEDGLWLIRHDAAHVLAAAVMELYPGVKISIGPPIEDGFYYDFDFPDGTKVSEDDFAAIEAKMREHIKADEHFEREDVSVATAIERFRDEGQDYKVELIEDLVENADPAHPVDTVSLYTNGPFTDLCRGPHGPGTKDVKAFKLTSVAGAYWRGDANNPMLTRIYGTAWGSKEQLEEHMRRLEEARERDHRKLGRELDLFMLSDLSPGLAVLAAERHAHLERADEAVAGHQRRARLHRGAHADPLRRRAVEAVGPLARLPRPHVLHGRGGEGHGPQAHELPRARADLQARPPLLPRPPDPLRRAGARPPARAERHAARPAARAPHHPGRRARLLPRGPDRGGGRPLPRLRLLHLRPVRAEAAAGALHAAGEAGRNRGDVGQGRGRAHARRSRTRASSTT